jgi:DNA-binding NarL/FixJ family response regulator
MTQMTSYQQGPAWAPELLRAAMKPVLQPALAQAALARCAGNQLLVSAATYVLVHTAASTQLTVSPPVAAGAELLSPRERELVALVARGYTDAQIAQQMFITVRTVSSHLDRIRNKTGCRRRADLTRLADRAGLV